ncbi:MAG: lipoate--protein ligase family protein [Pirellulaceae bacterium]|nr:lipoate--protein ligase family protein [Pirellulaceae bacterium]
MEFSEYISPRFSENLAFDEWLLGRAVERRGGTETLRIWRPQTHAVVIGRGSKFDNEVDTRFCAEHHIPVFRRHSGGAAIVTGPGCWMYSVVLDLSLRPELRDLHAAHQTVMEQMQRAAQVLTPKTKIQVQGICDLTVDGQKCSGNSLRVVRDHLLYHGTLLVDFDLRLLAGCLRTPPRQPEYRQQRPHGQFVANLACGCSDAADELWSQWRQQLKKGWRVSGNGPLTVTPEDQIAVGRLATEKYESSDWTRAR